MNGISLSRTTDTLWISSKHSNKLLCVTHKYKRKLMLLVFSDCSVFVLLCVAGRGVLVEHKAWLAANTGGLLSPSPPSGTCSKKRKVANLPWNHLLLSTPLDDSVAEETSVHSWEEANSGETGATLPLPPFSFFPLLFYFFKNPCNAHLIPDYFTGGLLFRGIALNRRIVSVFLHCWSGQEFDAILAKTVPFLSWSREIQSQQKIIALRCKVQESSEKMD